MLRCRQIYHDAELTIRAIESVDLWSGRSGGRCHAAGRIEPLAVVVTRQDREYALGVDGQPIEPDRWRQMLESAKSI